MSQIWTRNSSGKSLKELNCAIVANSPKLELVFDVIQVITLCNYLGKEVDFVQMINEVLVLEARKFCAGGRINRGDA